MSSGFHVVPPIGPQEARNGREVPLLEGSSRCLLSLRVTPGGFHMTAPVCSSFAWINRASIGRSRWEPLGKSVSDRIARASLMVSRAILACLLNSARGLWWVLEQPALSIMECHPAFRLLKRLWAHRTPRSIFEKGRGTLPSPLPAPNRAGVFRVLGDLYPGPSTPSE